MDLTPQDLWTLRNILITAIKDSHEVLAAAARRAKAERATPQIVKAVDKASPPTSPPPGPAPAKLAYTMKEAASLMSLSRSTLYRLIGEGVVPTFQFGGRRLIRASDLEALIAPGQVAS
jgi:excisionase family DNA binding protein